MFECLGEGLPAKSSAQFVYDLAWGSPADLDLLNSKIQALFAAANTRSVMLAFYAIELFADLTGAPLLRCLKPTVRQIEALSRVATGNQASYLARLCCSDPVVACPPPRNAARSLGVLVARSFQADNMIFIANAIKTAPEPKRVILALMRGLGAELAYLTSERDEPVQRFVAWMRQARDVHVITSFKNGLDQWSYEERERFDHGTWTQ